MEHKNIALLLLSFMLFNMISCSDVTNISKEQVQENMTMFDGTKSNMVNEDNQPLLVLNNKIYSRNLIKQIKAEYIDSIQIIKGETALQLYGEEGSNGVIMIFADANILTDLKDSESVE